MNNLRNISTEELEQELERRKSIPPKPQVMDSIHTDSLKGICIYYIELINNGDIDDLRDT